MRVSRSGMWTTLESLTSLWPSLTGVQCVTLDSKFRLLQHDGDGWLVEELVRKDRGPDLHPCRGRLLGQERHDLGECDGFRLRMRFEDGVQPEEVVGVPVRDVDLGQVLAGSGQPVGELLRLAFGNERVDEDGIAVAGDQRRRRRWPCCFPSAGPYRNRAWYGPVSGIEHIQFQRTRHCPSLFLP